MQINGIEYLDDGDLDRFPDGTVHDATLALVTLIDGIPCSGGRSVVYHPSGKLKLAWLARPTWVGGIPCEGGVVTRFHENGRLWNGQLDRPHTTGTTAHPAGVRLTFDEDGDLLEYERYLGDDQDVGGLPCMARHNVWHYADGAPSRLTLSRDYRVGIVEYPRGTELVMGELGDVEQSYPHDLDDGHHYRQRLEGAFELDMD